eukprot:CAMPEP_0174363262 /NCGR_PEP_ID=MMETSP0811_2-20130205/68140_1 /TAXON_ID=73025 ORGANISM="Eutreptiella gymnastica-like, Strain CCMP1594" /NCGR_SAMPLE_ID=MMETSP0811_2 /ASSEMBLY_ACC=CAM_ASM_000667 /LENGTH=105 /DNA_ID=CAMNT_0015501819 /DNA_START=33 /DNA_END=347 /DNA_ORIENTATION=-
MNGLQISAGSTWTGILGGGGEPESPLLSGWIFGTTICWIMYNIQQTDMATVIMQTVRHSRKQGIGKAKAECRNTTWCCLDKVVVGAKGRVDQGRFGAGGWGSETH